MVYSAGEGHGGGRAPNAPPVTFSEGMGEVGTRPHGALCSDVLQIMGAERFQTAGAGGWTLPEGCHPTLENPNPNSTLLTRGGVTAGGYVCLGRLSNRRVQGSSFKVPQGMPSRGTRHTQGSQCRGKVGQPLGCLPFGRQQRLGMV